MADREHAGSVAITSDAPVHQSSLHRARRSLLDTTGSQGDLATRLVLVPDDHLESELAVLLEAIGTAAEPFGVIRVMLLRFQPMDTFSLAAEWSVDPRVALTPRLGTDQHHPHSVRPYWHEEARVNTTPVFVRIDELPARASAERRTMETTGVESYVHATIRSGCRELGMLGIDFSSRFDADGDEEVLAGLLADTAKITAALSVALLRLESIDDPGAHLKLRLIRADDDELSGVLYDVLRDLGRWAGVDRASLLLANPDQTVSLVVGWESDDPALPQAMLAPSDARVPRSRWAWATSEVMAGRIVRVADVADTPPEAEPDRASWQHDGVRSVLIVPVLDDDGVRGALVLNAIRPKAWSDRQVHRAQLLATVLHPVIERFGRAERYRVAARHAEESLATTMELIARVSHDLKTPLHAIAGYAELIDGHRLSQRDRHALADIRSSARLLGSLVDDLLAASRPDTGQSTPLRAAAAQAAKQFESVADARHVVFTLDGVPESATMPLDPAKARQVLRCLLSGALLGITKDGAIRLRASDVGPSELTMDIESAQPIPHAALAFPTARALLQDVATIEIDRLGDAVAGLGVQVRVRFSPAA